MEKSLIKTNIEGYDFFADLDKIGLSEQQRNSVIQLFNNMPIHITSGIHNTKVSVCDGVILVEPNTESPIELFTVDFWDIMFLSESIIPEKPIARSYSFDKLSDVHYHLMNDNQREQLLRHVMKMDSFNYENEQLQHFVCRFSKTNQYIVHTNYNGFNTSCHAYIYNDKYHIEKDRFIAPEYIVKVEERQPKL
jgi:hypothetical protein